MSDLRIIRLVGALKEATDLIERVELNYGWKQIRIKLRGVIKDWEQAERDAAKEVVLATLNELGDLRKPPDQEAEGAQEL